MKINLDHKITRLDGTDFIDLESDGIDEKGKPKFKESKLLTLRKAIVDSLTSSYKDESNLDPKIKAQRGWLAMKIWNHPEPFIDLSVDDAKLCKDLIGKRYSPLIVTEAWEILDPDWNK